MQRLLGLRTTVVDEQSSLELLGRSGNKKDRARTVLNDVVEARLARWRTVDHDEVAPSNAIANAFRQVSHLNSESSRNASVVASAIKRDSQRADSFAIDLVRRGNQVQAVNCSVLGACNSDRQFQSAQARHGFIDQDEKIQENRAAFPIREPFTPPLTDRWTGIECRRHDLLQKFLSDTAEYSIGLAAALGREICGRILSPDLPIELFFEFRAMP